MTAEGGEDERRAVLEALVAQPSVVGVSEQGAELRLEPRELDGDHVIVRAPRLQLSGVETLTVRVALASQPFRVTMELRQAEYQSFDHALVRLRVRSLERDQASRVGRRQAVRAPGSVRVVAARNARAGNTYPIVIEERSPSGLRFSCEWDVVVGDSFAVSASVDGVRYAVRAIAVNVGEGPYGRRIVGARIA